MLLLLLCYSVDIKILPLVCYFPEMSYFVKQFKNSNLQSRQCKHYRSMDIHRERPLRTCRSKCSCYTDTNTHTHVQERTHAHALLTSARNRIYAPYLLSDKITGCDKQPARFWTDQTHMKETLHWYRSFNETCLLNSVEMKPTEGRLLLIEAAGHVPVGKIAFS